MMLVLSVKKEASENPSLVPAKDSGIWRVQALGLPSSPLPTKVTAQSIIPSHTHGAEKHEKGTDGDKAVMGGGVHYAEKAGQAGEAMSMRDGVAKIDNTGRRDLSSRYWTDGEFQRNVKKWYGREEV